MSTQANTAQSNTNNNTVEGRKGRKGNRGRGKGGVNKVGNSSAGKGGDVVHEGKELADKAAPLPEAANQVDESHELDSATTGDVCWICAEPVKYYSISECNHRTCHVCAIRLRALYKKLDCTFCKEPQNTVIFTTSAEALFSSFSPEDIPYNDPKLSVYFETEEMMEETLILLRFNCPDPDCDYIGNGWGDLRLHVRATHQKLMCDLCIRHKKVFAHEHAIYPPPSLAVHLPSTHKRLPVPKEPVEGGVHPLCRFCRECYFGDDELYVHMRKDHEECFLCKQNGIRDQYFQNYEALERHFTQAHHACTHPDCQAQKFVVFNTALDLNGHRIEAHGGDMTAKARKDARRVQADFAFEDVGRFGRRERERERDRDPPPQQQTSRPAAAQAEPSRPAQGGAARRREAFGATLTTEDGPSSNSNSRDISRSGTPPSVDVDPAVAERHAIFLARLQSLAPNPTNAVAAVKAATRGYRSSETTAKDLILTIWNILDRNLDHAASMVNAFVDLLEEEEKKQDLLASWKGFAIEQRRQFPELGTSTGGDYSGIASGRVLNAKHSTMSRSSSQSSRQLLDRVARAATSSAVTSPSPFLTVNRPSERFPALSSSSNATSATNTPFRQGPRNTPWASSSTVGSNFRPAAPFPTLQPISVHATTTAKPKGPPPPKFSNALFPELPTSSNTRSKPQVSGNVSLRNIVGGGGAPPTSAWGGGGSSGQNAAAAGSDANQGGGCALGKGKKARGKQKQTLFTLGSFPT